MNQQRADYILTAVVITFHVIVLAVAANVLAVFFEFPEILREPAIVRFGLFSENAGILIPAYFALALTGLSQVALTVLIGHVMVPAIGSERSAVLSLAIAFGVLTGLLQATGFIRWPILIPWLVEAWQAGMPIEQVALLEGAFNRYVGMASGELVGFMCQAIWTTLLGIAMLGNKLFDRSLGQVGIVIGAATFFVAIEPLRGLFAVFDVLSAPVNAALLVWLVVVASSLLRTPVPEGRGPVLGWKSWTGAVVVWAAATAPFLLG